MQSQSDLQSINGHDVHRAYKRWAPVYDVTFGKIVEAGTKQALKRVNRLSGKLLEVGVGTGLALPHYGPQLSVTGIDLSPDMLERARKRLNKSNHRNIEALLEMDATAMDFEDESFDVAVAMYVMTVVPDPQAVMHELARVLKPGGYLIVVNHFSVEKGLRGKIERGIAPHASKLGWRPEFPLETLLVSEKLKLVNSQEVRPFGLFTMLEFVKQP